MGEKNAKKKKKKKSLRGARRAQEKAGEKETTRTKAQSGKGPQQEKLAPMPQKKTRGEETSPGGKKRTAAKGFKGKKKGRSRAKGGGRSAQTWSVLRRVDQEKPRGNVIRDAGVGKPLSDSPVGLSGKKRTTREKRRGRGTTTAAEAKKRESTRNSVQDT